MTAMEMLDELQHRARQNKELKEKLINTRNAENPLQEFAASAVKRDWNSILWKSSAQEKNFTQP